MLASAAANANGSGCSEIVVKCLLEHNAQMDAKDSEGKTALQIALSPNHRWYRQ